MGQDFICETGWEWNFPITTHSQGTLPTPDSTWTEPALQLMEISRNLHNVHPQFDRAVSMGLNSTSFLLPDTMPSV